MTKTIKSERPLETASEPTSGQSFSEFLSSVTSGSKSYTPLLNHSWFSRTTPGKSER